MMNCLCGTGRRRTAGALCANDSGAAAVEFALVAFPFLALLFAVLQTSLVIFAGQILQTQVSNVSRKLMTGQFVGKSESQLREELCKGSIGLFDCSRMIVQVDAFADFAAANLGSSCFDPDEIGGASCYNPGDPLDVVVVRVIYPWPFGISLDELGKPHNLVALSAFRNEPF